MANAAQAAQFDEGSSWLRRLISLGIVVVVLGAAAAGIYYYFFAGDNAPVVASAQSEVKVTRGQLVNSFSTTGTANASLTSKLTFPLGGQVKSVGVAVGDRVTAGQELARLEDKDVQRQIESARINLTTAQIRLSQLTQGPTASDIAAANQTIIQAQNSIVSAQNGVTTAQNGVATAQNNVITAQTNLDKALAGPSSTDVIAADLAVIQAETSLSNLNNSIQTAWVTLLNAQKAYCTLDNILFNPCYGPDLPLSQTMINNLTEFIRTPGSAPPQVNPAIAAAQTLLQANTSYVNTKAGIPGAQKSLESANAKRAALNAPPDPATIAQLQAAIVSAQASVVTAQGNVVTAQGNVTAAQAGLVSAQAKYDALLAGAQPNDVALQEQSIKTAQIAYDTQVDNLDKLILKAPYDGTIGTVTMNVGDQVGAATVVSTLSNTSAIRVDLTVSETDINSIKAGQFAVATFDALPGGTYLLKITGVSNVAVVTQGVVTYPVQAQLLRGPDLQANAADLQKVVSALGSLTTRTGGAAAATGGAAPGGLPGGAGQGATRPAGAGGAAGGGAGGTRPAGASTPGAGGTAGGAGGGGLIAAFASQTLPSAGMTATVIVLVDVKDDVLLVPSTAIKRQGRASYAFVPGANGKPEQKTVTVGGTDGTNSTITAGLAEGDVVLVGVTATASTTPRAAATRPPTPAGGVR